MLLLTAKLLSHKDKCLLKRLRQSANVVALVWGTPKSDAIVASQERRVLYRRFWHAFRVCVYAPCVVACAPSTLSRARAALLHRSVRGSCAGRTYVRVRGHQLHRSAIHTVRERSVCSCGVACCTSCLLLTWALCMGGTADADQKTQANTTHSRRNNV